MGSRMKYFDIMGFFWEVREKQIYRGELPKKGGLDSADLRLGGLAKKREWCF